MGQLGPATSDILLIAQQNDDQWQIEFDEGLSLHVSWHPQKYCVIFSCGLGYATVIERERVYALLLNANLLLTGISGARLALSQPDEEVMLIGEYPLHSPSVEAMQRSLREFLLLALKYAEMIAIPTRSEASVSAVLLQHDASLGMQRA